MKNIYTTEFIYKSDSLCVGLNKPVDSLKKEDVIFITFDGIPGGFSSSGFGTEFLAKNGYVSLHLTCKRNTSYQLVSSDEVLTAIEKHIAEKKIFLYGSSAGAYAAMYFSSELNGTAIAFAPLCPPDPVLFGYFNNPNSQEFYHKPINEKDNSGSLSQFVILDPLNKADYIYFSERVLPGFPDAKVYNVPNGQHSVAKTLLNNGVLKKFFFSIVEEACFPTDVKIDPLKNPVFCGKTSLNKIAKGELDEAYSIIKDYHKYGVSRYSETAIKKLFFEYGFNFTANQLTLSRYRKNLSFRSDDVQEKIPSLVAQDSDFFWSLAKLLSDVFDFHAARSIVYLGLAYHPSSKKLKELSVEVEGFISRVEAG